MRKTELDEGYCSEWEFEGRQNQSFNKKKKNNLLPHLSFQISLSEIYK